MLENINPYNQTLWQNTFTKSDLYQKLEKDFDEILFEHFIENVTQHFTHRRILGSKIFSGTVFYYIDFLLRDNPKIIYDIGCGWNVFKKYLPIYGLDPKQKAADEIIAFEQLDRVLGTHVMSINALHFNQFSNLKEIVNKFIDSIDKGGKGFLALNVSRLEGFHMPSAELSIRKELFEYKNNFLVFDLDLSTPNAWMDGNLRMVIQK